MSRERAAARHIGGFEHLGQACIFIDLFHQQPGAHGRNVLLRRPIVLDDQQLGAGKEGGGGEGFAFHCLRLLAAVNIVGLLLAFLVCRQRGEAAEARARTATRPSACVCPAGVPVCCVDGVCGCVRFRQPGQNTTLKACLPVSATSLPVGLVPHSLPSRQMPQHSQYTNTQPQPTHRHTQPLLTHLNNVPPARVFVELGFCECVSGVGLLLRTHSSSPCFRLAGYSTPKFHPSSSPHPRRPHPDIHKHRARPSI